MHVTPARAGRAAPLPPDERRSAILAAVLPVVRARGVEVTTRELAEAAGVAEGTLFRVFDDKASLLSEAVATALDPADDIERLGAIDTALPLEERVTAAIRLGAARIEDMTLWMSLMHRLGRRAESWHGGGDPAAKSEWVRRQRTSMLLVRAQLRRLLEPDERRLRHPVDTVVDLLELTLAGAIAQSASRLRGGTEAQPPDPALLAEFFLNGVVGPVDPDPSGPTSPTHA